MLQENSACKENLQSADDQFLASPPEPIVSGDLGTFSRAIVVEAPGYAGRRAVHSAFSFAVHVAAVTAIVWFWPLVFPQRPYVFAMNRAFITSPIALTARPVRMALSFAPALSESSFSSIKLASPVKRPFVSHATSPPVDVFNSPSLRVTEPLGPVLGALVSEASRPVLMPALPIDVPRDAQIFRAGGDIRASRLIERVSFSYPEIAKVAHVFGRVVIAAVIDETGRVTEAHSVSGPGVLASAAIYDLSRERFQPTMLDGRPTKCNLTVRVTFHLAGWEDRYIPQ